MESKKFKIEKNIPIPPKSVGVANYPFADMKVGDSFLVNVEKGKDIKRSGKNIGSCAVRFCRSNKLKWGFTYRKISNNKVRIWRDK